MKPAWKLAADEMPDSDETVLIASRSADSEPVWLGYHNGEEWLTVEGHEVEVSHWAPMPSAPWEERR